MIEFHLLAIACFRSKQPLRLGLLKGEPPNMASLLTEEVVPLYALIETGGKQYRVKEGDTIYVEKLAAEEGETVRFEKVLLIGREEGTIIGKPTVDGASVIGKVEEHGKGKKIRVFKYKPKKNYKRTYGHRQPYTKVKIEKIEGIS